jgi:hypothetical protein
MCQTKSMTGTHKQTRTKDQCCYDMQSERQPTTMNHQIEQRLHSNDMSGLVTRLTPSLTGAINHRGQDAHFTFLNRPTIKLTLKNCGQESRDSVLTRLRKTIVCLLRLLQVLQNPNYPLSHCRCHSMLGTQPIDNLSTTIVCATTFTTTPTAPSFT